jgi:hypothetical protein
MNVEIGTVAPIFLFWEYLLPIFGIFSLQRVEEGGSLDIERLTLYKLQVGQS